MESGPDIAIRLAQLNKLSRLSISRYAMLRNGFATGGTNTALLINYVW